MKKFVIAAAMILATFGNAFADVTVQTVGDDFEGTSTSVIVVDGQVSRGDKGYAAMVILHKTGVINGIFGSNVAVNFATGDGHICAEPRGYKGVRNAFIRQGDRKARMYGNVLNRDQSAISFPLRKGTIKNMLAGQDILVKTQDSCGNTQIVRYSVANMSAEGRAALVKLKNNLKKD